MKKITQEELDLILNDHEQWRRSGYKSGKRAVLSGIDFKGTSIIARDLSGAILDHSRFDGINLRRTTFDGARLGNASFCGANLYRVNLNRARLNNTNFSRAISAFTIYTGINLAEIKNIDQLEHQAPSSVGADTLQITKSILAHNANPEALSKIKLFIRQCGVDDYLVQSISTHAERKHEKYVDVFISYSTVDKEFTEKLYYELQKSGVRCWYAPNALDIGDNFENEIDAAIRKCDKLLLICSENSLNSKWVQKEIARALRKEELEEHGEMVVLIPILLDKYIYEWKHRHQEDILEKLYLDFSEYKNNPSVFNMQFEKLLRALRK